MVCGGGFGGLWMKIGCFLLFFVVFCAFLCFLAFWCGVGGLGFWDGLLCGLGFGG